MSGLADDLRAERGFRAVADEQGQVARVAEIVLQVVPDPPAFAHARRADDDHRLLAVIQFFRILDVADVGKIAHAERIFVVAHRVVDSGLQ